MHFPSAVATIRRLAVVLLACATLGGSVSVRAMGSDALLAIDQNRAGVVERIVSKWAAPIAQSDAWLPIDELRLLLEGLRADHLLAASLAGFVLTVVALGWERWMSTSDAQFLEATSDR